MGTAPFINYWVPRYRYQYIAWLRNYDPSVYWDKYSTKRLKKIYHELRKKNKCLQVVS